MDFDKYTERSKGFVQAAQSLAQRRGHQQLAPEHLRVEWLVLENQDSQWIDIGHRGHRCRPGAVGAPLRARSWVLPDQPSLGCLTELALT